MNIRLMRFANDRLVDVWSMRQPAWYGHYHNGNRPAYRMRYERNGWMK